MKSIKGIDGLRELIGTHLGYSDWHTVTQRQIDAFAEATGDHQWIHVDTAKAAAGPFGRTIAHGFLTLSLLPMFLEQTYQVEGVRTRLNYGTNKVRFPAPVPVGSKVRGGVELLSVEEGAGGYLVTCRVTVELDGGEKPPCVAEIVTVLVP